MENEVIVSQKQEVNGIAMFSNAESFELGQRMAMVFSKSTLAPQQFQGNVGNCMIALNMAQRMKSDPLMVMQSLYIIHGKPAFETKFLIACFNASGKYSSIRYEWTGKENTDSWGCRAYTIEKSTGDVLKGVLVTIKMAKDEGWYTKTGSKWKTMPELMLQYRAAAFLIRTTAPEISLGFMTTEEVEDAEFVELPNNNVEQVNNEIKEEANKEEIAVEIQPEPKVVKEEKEEKEVKDKPKEEVKPMGEKQEPSFFGN